MTAGLWLARRRLVAACVDGAGPARPLRVAPTDDARRGLVEYLAAAGSALVAIDALARTEPLTTLAARRCLCVWLVDGALVRRLMQTEGARSSWF